MIFSIKDHDLFLDFYPHTAMLCQDIEHLSPAELSTIPNHCKFFVTVFTKVCLGLSFLVFSYYFLYFLYFHIFSKII